MKRWEQGRAVIEALLAERRLERVPASREQADLLVVQARKHLVSAGAIARDDPEGGYAMVYDAARKALTAVLENEGLRVTSQRGHHVTLYEAVVAQLDPPMGAQLRPFPRMQRRRGAAEYPSGDQPLLTGEDVSEDATKAASIVDVCDKVLDHMPVF